MEMQSDPNSDTLSQLQTLHSGADPVEPAPEPEPVIEAAAEVDPDAPVIEPIIVDGQEFATEKEAYAHMQKKVADSETERLILEARQDAYETAMQHQQPIQPVAEAAPIPEDDTDEFYADPQKYLAKKQASMRASIKDEIMAGINQQSEDQKLWSEFFTSHPDLEGFQEDCEQTLNRNIDAIKAISRKDRTKAMQYLATKTREKFQAYTERSKPRQELANTNAGPSSGGNAGVTQSTKPTSQEKPLDFVAQMNSLRR